MLAYLISLRDALAAYIGDACALVLMFVLPPIFLLSLLLEINMYEPLDGLKRGFQIASVFVVATTVACAASVGWNSMGGSFFSGFGVAVIHVAVIAGTFLLFSTKTN